MAYPVAHFEIVGKDGPKLHQFYRDLFGWEVKADNPMNYGYVNIGATPLTGGISPPWGGLDGYVTIYVKVPDLAAHLKRAEELGGKVLLPPTDIPGGGSIAHFADPSGNRIGLIKG
jgi:predicted enzyme related to lactoylglutathione lyase